MIGKQKLIYLAAGIMGLVLAVSVSCIKKVEPPAQPNYNAENEAGGSSMRPQIRRQIS